MQLKLGAISVFLSPTGDNLGAGVTYMVLPLSLLLVPIALFFNDPSRRLKYLEYTMLIKAFMAFLLSLDLTREFLSQGGARVGYSLSLIFLAGEWTVICVVLYLSQRAPRPLIYLATLAASYFLGQTLALNLAPYVVSQPFSNSFAALSGAFYILAFYAAKRCHNYRLVPASALASAHVENSHNDSHHTGPLRLLAATVLLYTPLHLPLILSLFYALQGYQTGTVTFSDLAARGTLAYAVGAFGSIFLHHLASRRRVLQLVAVAAVLLSAAGGLSYSYDTSLFTVMTVTAIAGFVTPDWENHLLSVLDARVMAPFFAARNTLVMLAIAILSPAVERTLAVVSALYLLKELNFIVLSTALLAILVAPLLLARPRRHQRLPLNEPRPLVMSETV